MDFNQQAQFQNISGWLASISRDLGNINMNLMQIVKALNRMNKNE